MRLRWDASASGVVAGAEADAASGVFADVDSAGGLVAGAGVVVALPAADAAATPLYHQNLQCALPFLVTWKLPCLVKQELPFLAKRELPFFVKRELPFLVKRELPFLVKRF
eukprot:s1504_g8.t1